MISKLFNRSSLIIVSLLVIATSCNNNQQLVDGGGLDNDELTLAVSFERTGCLGECPIFKAEFYSNGTLRYHGIQFVENRGHFVGKVTSEEIEEIYQLANKIEFFDMEDKYDAKVTDVPSQIYGISMHGKEKKVFARYNAPPDLKGLGAHIDQLLSRTDLEKDPDHDH